MTDSHIKKRAKFLFRWSVRFGMVALAVLFVLGGPLPSVLTGVFPGLSPLVVISGNLTEMSWYSGFFWGAPAVAVLVVAMWRGRFFCRWICPAGTLHSLAGNVSRKKKLLSYKVSGPIFWAILGGALAGMPTLVFLDPLSGFGRITPFLKGVGSVAAIIPGIVLPLFIILSLIQPVVWCSHFCPLGYFFDLVHIRRRNPVYRHPETRRHLLAGLAIGLPLAYLGRKFPIAKAGAAKVPAILPPGAGNIDRFAARCSRCYACVNVCPTKIIRPNMPVNRSFNQFFLPEIDFKSYEGQAGDSRSGSMTGFCDQFCTLCTEACPTGAILKLSEEEKEKKKIGTAAVQKEACLAWEDREHCMVCQEYCPYLAIEEDVSADGIPRPVVDAEICRGCGLCQSQCPAERKGVAIVVRGVEEQSTARSFY